MESLLPPRRKRITGINIVPLIDVMTALIFFFLMSMKFDDLRQLGITPPQSDSAAETGGAAAVGLGGGNRRRGAATRRRREQGRRIFRQRRTCSRRGARRQARAHRRRTKNFRRGHRRRRGRGDEIRGLRRGRGAAQRLGNSPDDAAERRIIPSLFPFSFSPSFKNAL